MHWSFSQSLDIITTYLEHSSTTFYWVNPILGIFTWVFVYTVRITSLYENQEVQAADFMLGAGEIIGISQSDFKNSSLGFKL